jgi:hypothetical protein
MKAKFSHVMNDGDTGITFLYFDGGTIQSLNDKDFDTDFHSEFCIHLDSHDHKKLETALRKEPYDCETFNEEEMETLKALLTTDGKFLYCKEDSHSRAYKPSSMSDSEWENFLEKLT